jgi:serine/threonine protein kinase
MEKYTADSNIRYWKSRKAELLQAGQKGYRLKNEELGLNPKALEQLKEKQRAAAVVIAQIDQDGFLLSNLGDIQRAPMVEQKQFLPRKRFNLKVVTVGDYVGVKKCYAGNKPAFVNEVQALHKLTLTECNVPAIMDVDFDNLTLTISYIQGAVIREELAKKGAVLRDRDVENNPAYAGLSAKEKQLKRIEQGRRFLYDVVDGKQIEDLFDNIREIHKAGYILKDIKYGNVIIEERSGKLYLIDFDYVRNCSGLGRYAFKILQDRDIENFNLHFGTNKLTYKRIREKIKEKDLLARNKWYGPVHFGYGLRVGSLWDLNVGYGRWHYILKRNFPQLSQKRILDLGANNASNALLMLRSGARQVIAIELNNKNIEQGNFVKEAFEWADNKRYNFKYIRGNMAEVPKMGLGKFDLVTALCSIYYLDDDSITRLIQYISTLTNVIILQCNIARQLGRTDKYTYTKASVDYAVKTLKANGFAVVKVIAPYLYSRPLVIGKK